MSGRPTSWLQTAVAAEAGFRQKISARSKALRKWAALRPTLKLLPLVYNL